MTIALSPAAGPEDHEAGGRRAAVALEQEGAFRSWLGITVHRGTASAIRSGLDHRDFDALADHATVAIAGHGFGSRRARILVASRIGLYLGSYLPPRPWTLRGVEVQVGRGRVDLCWETPVELSPSVPAGSLVFDELKVTSLAWVSGDPSFAAQANRYDQDGAAVFGSRLLGTRIIALNPPSGAWLTPRLRRQAGSLPWLGERGGGA